MSAQLLRDLARVHINEHIENEMRALTERLTGTADELRLHQGVILGLRAALDAMDNAMKKIHGG